MNHSLLKTAALLTLAFAIGAPQAAGAFGGGFRGGGCARRWLRRRRFWRRAGPRAGLGRRR